MASNFYYKDIDLKFEKTSASDIAVLTDLNAIKASLYNILFISNNENFFSDGFGIGIKNVLGEIMDDFTTDQINYLIRAAIEKDRRIARLLSLVIEPNLITQEYKIIIKVQLANVIEPQDIDLILKKTR